MTPLTICCKIKAAKTAGWEGKFIMANIIEIWRHEFDNFLKYGGHRMNSKITVSKAIKTEKKILAEYKRQTENTQNT